MPHKDPTARREYHQQWARANPAKRSKYERTRREKGGEARKDVVRRYSRKYRWRVENMPAPTRPEPEWCECCGRFLEKTPHNDHDHATGKFRGWICGPCNHALGLLGDTREGVEKALAYLDRAERGA